jgi:hypothetical protein
MVLSFIQVNFPLIQVTQKTLFFQFMTVILASKHREKTGIVLAIGGAGL